MISSIKNFFDFESINPSIKYLSVVAFFTGFVLGYFITVIVILQKYEGFSESTIGIIASCSPLGLISAGFIVSRVLEKLGFFKTLLLSVCFHIICIFSMFVFFNPVILAICFFIFGFMGGLSWMTMDTWVNVVSTNSNRGKAIGIYNSAVTIGLALGPLFVGIFGVEGIIPLTLSLILLFFRLGTLILIRKHVNNVKIPIQSKEFKLSILKISPFIFIAIFLGGVDDSTFVSLFPAYMINDLFTDKQIGIYMFIGGIFGVICQPLVGALTDIVSKRKILFGLLYCHILWLLILHYSDGNIYMVLISVMVGGFASTSLYTVTLAYLGERIEVKDIAVATSIFIIVYEIGEFLGPITVGIMMDNNGNSGFIFTLLCFVIFCIIVGYVRSLLRK